MNISDIKVDDEFKSLLPRLSQDEIEGLEKDIRIHGVLDPIILWNGFIADGHNRYYICQKLGIESVDTKCLHKDSKAEVMEWIIDHQFARRNLTKSQTVRSWEKVRQQYAEEATKNVGGRPRKEEKPTANLPQVFNRKRNPTTSERIAEKIGVSDKTYRNMRTIVNEGTQEQIERMDKGGKGNSVSAIANEVRDRKDGMPEGFRKCSKCGQIKPVSDFGKGNARHCKSCVGEYSSSKNEKRCPSCGKIFPKDQIKRSGYCNKCHNKKTLEAKWDFGTSKFLKDESRIEITEETTKNEVEWTIDDFKNSFKDVLRDKPYNKETIRELLNNFIGWIDNVKGEL